MGVFDFVKMAGQKLGFGDDEPQAEAAPSGPSAEELKRLRDRRRAARLADLVGKMGLEVADLAVRVDGDQATVQGKVKSQEVREKIILTVGNTEGIARVDDRLEVAKPEAEAVFYTVVRGDTLSGIAKKHYGNAMKYPVIFEANKPMLSDPDKIYPGQVLRIPPLTG